MSPELPQVPSSRTITAESAIVGLAVMLILLPWLFVSSPQYREMTTLIFGILATGLGWLLPQVRRVAIDPMARWVIGCIVVAQSAAMVGGWLHGNSLDRVLWSGISGSMGIFGIGILGLVLLQPRWRTHARWALTGLAVLLVTASLLGFFVITRWHSDLTLLTPHMDPRRLALIWPMRLLAGDLGQHFWGHTNTAAFLFAVAWVLVVDAMFRRSRFAWAGWLLALLLGLAVFLTASRSAWVMVLLALPPLLAFRGWRFPLKVGALLALTGFFGLAGVNYTVNRLAKPVTSGQQVPPEDIPGKIHVSGLIERGSSGRMAAYQTLWHELDGDHLFGHGLAVTRTPAGHQLHEHSSYVATLRGGGLVALAAHLVLMGCTLSAALALARDGCRWPLVLAIAVFSGLLFDRSTVFRLTGFEEFPLHWLAVWIPLAMRTHSLTFLKTARPPSPCT